MTLLNTTPSMRLLGNSAASHEHVMEHQPRKYAYRVKGAVFKCPLTNSRKWSEYDGSSIVPD